MSNILRDDIEYIVHSDSDGNIIGPISKKHAHLDGVRSALTHYSSWSMIYNLKSGKYGIQLKNPKKHDKYSAGKWDMGVAGHNCYIRGDKSYKPLNFDENLIKEAEEEIGVNVEMFQSEEEFIKAIKNQAEKTIGYIFEKFHYKTETDNEWVGLGFIVVPNEDVKFNDNEVIDFKWLSPDELKEFIENNTNYCAPLPLVFEKAEGFRERLLLNKF